MCPGATRGQPPGVDRISQGVIPRRFKRKKNFVTNGRTDERTHGRTDRRDGRNSDLDYFFICHMGVFESVSV